MKQDLHVVVYPAEDRGREPWKHLLNRAIEARGATVEGYTRARLLRRRYDVVALHHVEYLAYLEPRRRAVVRAASFVGLVALARLRGAVVVWTVHNLRPHDAKWPGLADRLLRATARLADGVLVFSHTAEAQVLDEWPVLGRRPRRVLPHGHFRDEYPDDVTRAEARATLGIGAEATVLAFVGQIRPYKGVPELLAAFAELEDPTAVLLIAGQPVDEVMREEVTRLAGRDPRVRLELEFIAGDRLQVLLRAADLAVLPFRRILNSGSALLALSFDCPILVPDIGPMEELATSVGEAWVQRYEEPLAATGLRAALDATAELAGRRAPLDQHDWSTIGARTADFYRDVLATRRRGRVS